MFRAKFRVLEKSEHFIAIYPTEDERKAGAKPRQERRVKVKFRPVTAKNQWSNSTDECEENRAFWESTPSGECELDMRPEEAESYVGGTCYYIDFQPHTQGTWSLQSDVFSHGYSPGLEFVLRPVGETGKLKMYVHNPDTNLHLVEVLHTQKVEQLELRKRAPSEVSCPRWSVKFIPAPG